MSTPKSHHSKVPNIASYIFIGLGQVGNFTNGSSWVTGRININFRSKLLKFRVKFSLHILEYTQTVQNYVYFVLYELFNFDDDLDISF